MSKKKKEEKQKASTRRMIGIKEITEDSLVTYDHGELVFFLVKPTNISVLSCNIDYMQRDKTVQKHSEKSNR